MQITIQRRLAEAIALKLHYDYLCFKGRTMGEAYLTSAVSELLVSFFGSRDFEVHAGFVHPVLALPAHSKPGRKPEIDFVVTRRGHTEIEFALELKWAGSSHCNYDNILWDLVRLHSLKNQVPQAKTSLLIAGHKPDFIRLFKSRYLEPGTQHPLAQSTLKRKNFSLTQNADHQAKISRQMSSWKHDYPSLHIPDNIITTLSDPRFSARDDARFLSKIWTVET